MQEHNEMENIMYELSFIIPVRVDNEERLQNLRSSLRFITQNFIGAEVIVVEDSSQRSLEILISQFSAVKYEHRENNGRFSKSVTVNRGASLARGEFLVLYDLDVLINPEAIYKCVKICKKGVKSFIIPHNTIFVNVAGVTKQQLVESLDISLIPFFKSLNQEIANPDIKIYPIPSGIIFIKRDVFLCQGGYNKLMISYGWEDIEILKRMAKIRYFPFILGKYNVIHLDHERGADSIANEHYEKNKAEFNKVKGLSRKDLEKYIDSNLVLCENKDNASKNMREEQYSKNLLYFSYFEFLWNRIISAIRIRGLVGFLKYLIKKFNK